MLNVFLDNLAFIIIGGSVIIIIIVGYFLLVRPSSYVKEDEEKAKNAEKAEKSKSRKQIKPDRKKDAKNFENYLLNNDKEEDDKENDDEDDDADDNDYDDPYDGSDDEDDVVDEKDIKTADQLLKNLQKKNEMAEESPIDETEYADESDDEDDLGKYHILYREKDDMWYVKRENSSRTIRVLHSKKEAIAYATIKAINQDSNIVIHGKDGKIEKHGY